MSWGKVFASLLSLTSSFLWNNWILRSSTASRSLPSWPMEMVARQVKNHILWQEAFILVYLMPPSPYPSPFDCIFKPIHSTSFFLFKHEGGRDENIPMAINFFRFLLILLHDWRYIFWESDCISLFLSHQKWVVVTGLIGVGPVFISSGTYIPRRQHIH